jgi:hypothetical protein
LQKYTLCGNRKGSMGQNYLSSKILLLKFTVTLDEKHTFLLSSRVCSFARLAKG